MSPTTVMLTRRQPEQLAALAVEMGAPSQSEQDRRALAADKCFLGRTPKVMT